MNLDVTTFQILHAVSTETVTYSNWNPTRRRGGSVQIASSCRFSGRPPTSSDELTLSTWACDALSIHGRCQTHTRCRDSHHRNDALAISSSGGQQADRLLTRAVDQKRADFLPVSQGSQLRRLDDATALSLSLSLAHQRSIFRSFVAVTRCRLMMYQRWTRVSFLCYKPNSIDQLACKHCNSFLRDVCLSICPSVASRLCYVETTQTRITIVFNDG